MNIRRLIAATVLALAVAGCAVVPPPYTQHAPPRHFCYGEGGTAPTCVSPGSAGR